MRRPRPERVELSDGSVTLSFYSDQRRVESLLLDTDGCTVLRRAISESDGAGNTTKMLEDHTINSGCTGSAPTERIGDESSVDDFVISTYTYDTADRLTQVAIEGRTDSSDSEHQVRVFKYDSRGFGSRACRRFNGPRGVHSARKPRCRHRAER